jgi:hypothetical protein
MRDGSIGQRSVSSGVGILGEQGEVVVFEGPCEAVQDGASPRTNNRGPVTAARFVGPAKGSPSELRRPQHPDARWCCRRRQWRPFGAIKYARMRSATRPAICGRTSGWCFPTRSDGPWNRATFSRMCTGRCSRELDWPPVTFHALRHTAATLLLGEGEHPRVVQELLGHAQVSITMDRYSHMTPRLMSSAAALMDRLLDGEEPSSQAPDSS